MNDLLTSDVQLGLADLFDNPKRYDAWKDTSTHEIYGAEMAQRRQNIDALPPSLVSGTPLAEQLSKTDKRHDGLGRSLYHLRLSVMAHPDATPEQRAAADKINTLIPKLGLLQKGYADEAAAARKNRKQIPTLQPELATLPTPIGGTTDSWAESFVHEGEHIHQLLSDRALIGAEKESRESPGSLRSSTIRLLGDVRRSLAAELRNNSNLPRNLVAIVFGYFDLLNDFRVKQPSGKKPPKPPPVEPAEQ